MKIKPLIHGLYVITDPELIANKQLIPSVEQAIIGGACCIQYRDKESSDKIRYQQAKALYKLCRSYQRPLIINDDIFLAKAVNADGVHLGRNDATIEQARDLLGTAAIIGISCYNQFEIAQDAVSKGADYVAFGAFYPSTSKPDAVAADTGLLKSASDSLDIPIVAIGGITPENATALLDAGADSLAVIHGVFAQTDSRSAAADYAALFTAEAVRQQTNIY